MYWKKDKGGKRGLSDRSLRRRHWRLRPFVHNLNRRNCSLGSLLVSVEKATDEISATGGHRLLSAFGVLFGEDRWGKGAFR